ncbi:hypothetical protein [Sphingomonas sp. LR61]|uniref:hypothetical protein n=1 Tax=Sphingomonas sp. LR61 TaxID=3050234 RepID=UPI003FA706ED
MDWPSVVGEELAKHSTPVTIDDGALVDPDATRRPGRRSSDLMRASVTTTIAERHPEAGVESIRVSRAGRPHLETRPQDGPGARSSRHLRLSRRNHPVVPKKPACGPDEPSKEGALR